MDGQTNSGPAGAVAGDTDQLRPFGPEPTNDATPERLGLEIVAAGGRTLADVADVVLGVGVQLDAWENMGADARMSFLENILCHAADLLDLAAMLTRGATADGLRAAGDAVGAAPFGPDNTRPVPWAEYGPPGLPADATPPEPARSVFAA